jgi:hypothetical protein
MVRIRTLLEWLVILVPVMIAIWLVFTLATGSGLPFMSPADQQDGQSGLPGGLGGLYQDPLPEPLTFSKTMGDWQYTLTSRFRYVIAGKIVAQKTYPEYDHKRIIPLDVSVVTGDLVTPESLQYFRFSLADRSLTYSYEVPEYTGLTELYIDEHISNNHLAFLNETLRSEVAGAAVGDCIVIHGYLVDINGQRSNGEHFTLPTSTIRTDSYPEGCEVVLVTAFEKVRC